jgi:hypothetical protein
MNKKINKPQIHLTNAKNSGIAEYFLQQEVIAERKGFKQSFTI